MYERVDEHDLALQRAIFESFAATGAPLHRRLTYARSPRSTSSRSTTTAQVLMAHPFAAHPDGARVDAGGRTWWGNCAWDAFGIVAALGLQDATITAQGITLGPR